MNWYKPKKSERHSFTTPSGHRDILLKPWRSMTIILGAEVRSMLSLFSSNLVGEMLSFCERRPKRNTLLVLWLVNLVRFVNQPNKRHPKRCTQLVLWLVNLVRPSINLTWRWGGKRSTRLSVYIRCIARSRAWLRSRGMVLSSWVSGLIVTTWSRDRNYDYRYF